MTKTIKNAGNKPTIKTRSGTLQTLGILSCVRKEFTLFSSSSLFTKPVEKSPNHINSLAYYCKFVQSTIHFGKNINIFWHNSFTESWSSFWLSFLEISKILTKISFFKFQTENFFSGKRYGNFSKKKIVSSRSLKWETNKKPTYNKPRTVPII